MSPVELIDGPFLMRHEHVAGTLVERREIAQTSSRANGVLHHPPEAFKRIEVMAAMGGRMEAKLVVVVLQVASSLCTRWRPLRSTTITTSLPVGRKVAITWWIYWRNSWASKCGTSLEKTFEVPYWTAPMTLSSTPLVIRLHERYCPTSAFATFFLFDLALGQRARGPALSLGAAHQPNLGRAKRHTIVSSSYEFIPLCGRHSRGSSTWRTRSSTSVGCGATLSLAGASAVAASKTEAAYRRWASAIG